MKTDLRTILFLAGMALVTSNPCAWAHTDVTAEEAQALVDSPDDLIVVDVRERSEYCDAVGHIPGARNYPWNSGVLQARYEELPMDAPILVVCRSGGRSNAAANFLDSKGFLTVYDMLGGMSAWAWETVPCKYSGGSGTADDPYQIATAEDLIILGETPEDYDKHFILTADIDLDPNLPDGKVFDRAVIAPDINDADYWKFDGISFNGAFDGNNHTISNLTITGVSYLGLFGKLGPGGEITDLGVAGVNITGSYTAIGGLVGDNDQGSITKSYSTGIVTGYNFVGGLVGYNNYGDISLSYSNCSASGTTSGNQGVGGLAGVSAGSITTSYSTGDVSAQRKVGGLVGYNYESNITNCYSTGMVSGDRDVGGLVGFNKDGNITESHSSGTVSGGVWNVGGLVGYNREGDISNSYSTGTVTGTDEAVGGLVGNNTGSISASYSAGMVTGNREVGGLVGANWASIINSYSASTVTGDDGVGGLVGINQSDSIIDRSYSTSTVTGNERVGGLVGDNRGGITVSYSNGTVSGNWVGGLVGVGLPGLATGCVWDVETSGSSGSAGGKGLTTVEMTDPYILGLNGFANDPNWILDAGRDYPRLAWEGTAGEIIPEPEIDWIEGNGTDEYPYRIETANQLILLGKASILWERHFVLGDDIDLDPSLPDVDVFAQAVIPSFTGVFDGNDHAILHLAITGEDYLGLFGDLTSGAEVKNLGVVDVNIIGYSVVGALVGYNTGGSITNCYSTGTVSGLSAVGGLAGGNLEGSIATSYSAGTVGGNSIVGGLVGSNGGIINTSYSTSTVTGTDWDVGGLVGRNGGSIKASYSTGMVTGNKEVGGLVGNNWPGSIIASYSTCTVRGIKDVGGLVGDNNKGSITTSCSTGMVTGNDDVGGLAGINHEGSITTSYSTGRVNGNRWVGGLVGYTSGGTITTSYSTGLVIGTDSGVGGLAGSGWGYVGSSFWDVENSGQASSTGGTSLTTAEMQMASTFLEAGWDFVGETVNGPNDVWKMWDGYDYPRLAWEPGPNTPLVFVDINDPGFYGQMSKYEVTNAQYCDFLNSALASGDITVNGADVEGAGGSNSGEDYIGQRYYRCDGSGYTGYGATNGGAARIHYSGGAFIVDNGFGNHPVTYVSWYGAMAFANYYGYSLPTEDQWQAVADYDGTYIYGCGENIDPGIANYRGSAHPDGTVPVGSFGQYGYGMSDMAGNVWEWTSSSIDSSRIFRGGSLGSIDADCDVSIRGDGIPYANYWDVGFRVCR